MESATVTLANGSLFEDRYEIQGELGSGSFSRVYRARQLSTGQSVAIKLLSAREGAGREVERFRREMEICAALSHPNVVGLIDSGETASGQLYAVFEQLEGEPPTERSDLYSWGLIFLECLTGRHAFAEKGALARLLEGGGGVAIPGWLQGHAKGAMGGRLGGIFEHLEKLSAETPPPHFDLARFPEADLDGDGTLSDGEWQTFAEQGRERLLARLTARAPEADADQDGVISEAELAALKAKCAARRSQRILAEHPQADTDGDGVLSDAEVEAFMADRAEQRRARIIERHPEADLDGDGSLSEEEAWTFRHGNRGRGGPH